MTGANTTTVLPELFEMLGEIASDHMQRVAESRGSVVVPLLLEGADSWKGLLHEYARAVSGSVVRAEEYVDGCDSQCGSDLDGLSDLRIGAEHVCDQLPGLQLSAEEGFFRVTGQSRGADSAGQDVLRGVIAALFAPELREGQFVVFVYDEQALDEVVAGPLWSLLMRIAQLTPSASPRTIVVVAGDADLLIDRHCVGDPSLRYRVSEFEVSRRFSWDRSRATVTAVGKHPREDAPLLFVFTGAGASTQYGLPTGNELRDRAVSHFLGAGAEGKSAAAQREMLFDVLRDRERLTLQERDAGQQNFAESLTLERVLREEQADERRSDSGTIRSFIDSHETSVKALSSDEASTSAPSSLARLVESERRLVLVTVNFDQMLEHQVGEALRPFVGESDFAEFDSHLAAYAAGDDDRVPYVKLHGDVGDVSTIVANIDEAQAGLTESRLAALRTLRDWQAPIRPWLYVGYSMRDRDIEPVLGAPDPASGLTEWWVGPFVDPSVRAFIERYRLAKWRLTDPEVTVEHRVITLTAEEFFTQLGQELA